MDLLPGPPDHDDEPPADPRLREPDRLGMPTTLIDGDENLPGDQTPPDDTDAADDTAGDER